MKIALVCPYDFAYPGGVVNHVTALEKQLSLMGHDVRVIAPASHDIGLFNGRFIRIGRPSPLPTSGTVVRISISLRLAGQIKETLAREKFDIIHLHEPFMIMLCSAMLRFSKTVNVGTFHAAGGRPGYNLGWPVSRIVLRRRARKLAGRIAVSETALKYAGKYVKGPYAVIPNGIELGHFSPGVAPIETLRDGKLNILFVGRLEARKGLEYLIKAFATVKESCPEARLVIVGPGTRLRQRYEAMVSKLGLDDVVFVGPVSHDELPRYYQTADVFCAPATGGESFGIVLLEAMALGKPIVASGIEGYASVMTDGQEGILVRPRDIRELSQALLRLLGDEALRRQMGSRGSVTVQRYSWAVVAEKVAAYYQKVIGGISSSPEAKAAMANDNPSAETASTLKPARAGA